MSKMSMMLKEFDPKDVVIIARKNQNRRGRPIEDLVTGYIAYKNKDTAFVYVSFNKDFAQKYTLADDDWGFNIGEWRDSLVLVYQKNGWKVSAKRDGRRYCLNFEIKLEPGIKKFLNGLQKQNIRGEVFSDTHILLEAVS